MDKKESEYLDDLAYEFFKDPDFYRNLIKKQDIYSALAVMDLFIRIDKDE